jgi:hypothetical protein
MEKIKGQKTCYYELLEVDKEATQKDIEKVKITELSSLTFYDRDIRRQH